jgi:protein CpxP
MKSTRTRVLVIGAAVILAVAVALAQGMHGHGGPGGFDHMLGFYSDALDLSSAQQDQIKGIWQKEKPALEPLMQQMKQFHSQMNQFDQSGTFDEAKVRALATQQSQTMIELAVQHARIKSEMLQILTPDQKTKFAQLQAKHEQRMQNHMQHMKNAPEPPSD